MAETLIRFMIGGIFVSVFAVLSDILKPKSFAGLFGAAPSIALATLILTTHSRGRYFAAAEARSMKLRRGGIFRLRLCRMSANHALQATGVGDRDHIDFDLASRRSRPRINDRQMMIRIDLTGLTRTKWYEYAIRFLFGGLITVATGVIAQHWGPGIGGLSGFSGDVPGQRDADRKAREAKEKTRRSPRHRSRPRGRCARCGGSRARLYRPGRIRACRLATPGPLRDLAGSWGAALLWLGVSGLSWQLS